MHLCPRGSRPCFLLAITFLELGSNTSNVFHLSRGTAYARAGTAIYCVGMTLANALTALVTVTWNRRARDGGWHALGRWPPMGVWFVLIYFRQEEALRLTLS